MDKQLCNGSRKQETFLVSIVGAALVLSVRISLMFRHRLPLVKPLLRALTSRPNNKTGSEWISQTNLWYYRRCRKFNIFTGWKIRVFWRRFWKPCYVTTIKASDILCVQCGISLSQTPLAHACLLPVVLRDLSLVVDLIHVHPLHIISFLLWCLPARNPWSACTVSKYIFNKWVQTASDWHVWRYPPL